MKDNLYFAIGVFCGAAILAVLSFMGLFPFSTPLPLSDNQTATQNTTALEGWQKIKEVIKEVPTDITIEKEKVVEKIIEVPRGWKLKDSISPLLGYNEVFDCDDVAIYSYLYLSSLGYKVTFMYGNLEMTGETYSQSNHYWVMITDNGTQYPYDYGFYLPDPQHFEGREVAYREVLRWTLADQVR